MEAISGNVNQLRSWDQAKARCVAGGGVLATINSKDVNDFLSGLTVAHIDVWIGLNDKRKKGTFEWDQESLISKLYAIVNCKPF